MEKPQCWSGAGQVKLIDKGVKLGGEEGGVKGDKVTRQAVGVVGALGRHVALLGGL